MFGSTLAGTAASQVIPLLGVRVDNTQTSNPPNGASPDWSLAYPNLQQGIDVARVLDRSVWIRGTGAPYYPVAPDPDPAVAGDPRAVRFETDQDDAIIGAFAGTETSVFSRVGQASLTILSGDLGAPGVVADNCYSVVTSIGPGKRVLIDLVVEGGNADGPTPSFRSGGGIRGWSAFYDLRGVELRQNRAIHRGGAIALTEKLDYLNPTSGTLCTTNALQMGRCKVHHNFAQVGGGIYVAMLEELNLSFGQGRDGNGIHNCELYDNAASVGGAIAVENAEPIAAGTRRSLSVYNSVIHSNRALYGGGIFVGYTPRIEIASSTITANWAAEGSGLYLLPFTWTSTGPTVPLPVDFDGEDPWHPCGVAYETDLVPMQDTIVWGNLGSMFEIFNPARLNVTFSNTAGGVLPGSGNLSVNPPFVDPTTRNFRLLLGSACIDAGDPAAPLMQDFADVDVDWDDADDIEIDMDATPRVQGARIDMGAFEGGSGS